MGDDIGLKVRAGVPHEEAPSESIPNAYTMAGPPLPGLRNEPPPVPAPAPAMSLVRYFDEPLWRVKGWIQLLGILCIIHGGLCVLSLWGILVCWLPIWIGMTLLKAAKNIRAAAELDNQDHMRQATEKLALYFKILGIVTVIGLLLCAVAFVAGALGLVGSAAMMKQAMQAMPAQ